MGDDLKVKISRETADTVFATATIPKSLELGTVSLNDQKCQAVSGGFDCGNEFVALKKNKLSFTLDKPSGFISIMARGENGTYGWLIRATDEAALQPPPAPVFDTPTQPTPKPEESKWTGGCP